MPAIKTGRTFVCKYCGTAFYRRGSHIKRGITKSCGAAECKSKSMMGANNPFWGKVHSQVVRDQLAERVFLPNKRRTGPPKGYTHTAEAKVKMSTALKERWATRRDFMIANLPRGEDHHWRKSNHIPRHRSKFTPLQLKTWKANCCAWCQTTDDLALDHIIAVVAGGKNIRENAQTLCRTCNLWKATFIDRPFYLAGLAHQ